uniref:Transposable element Tcb2 transposase n=1 Tax=Ceratitis capitata TaxID=7213 RepID=W8ASQ9_CERCA
MERFVFDSMLLNWTFMQDSDPKHTAKVTQDWLKKENIRILDWPVQSPDLNPIENLWNDVKTKISAKNSMICGRTSRDSGTPYQKQNMRNLLRAWDADVKLLLKIVDILPNTNR